MPCVVLVTETYKNIVPAAAALKEFSNEDTMAQKFS